MKQDEIHIADLEVSCIVGILPHERIMKQPVIIDTALTMDLTGAAVKNDLALSADYALLSQQIQFILETAQFELLETAALAIVSWLAAPSSQDQTITVNAASVRIRKPKALGGNGIASVRINRRSEDIEVETNDAQDFVFKSQRVAILRVKSKSSVAPPEFPNFKDFPGQGDTGLRVAWR